MIRVSVQAVLETDAADSFQLYVIHSPETCLYVGQSVDIRQRVLAHLGRGRFANRTAAGDFLLAHGDAFLAWPVDLWTVAETGQPTMNDAEIALIHHYRPALNAMHNPYQRTVLPEGDDLFKDNVVSRLGL